MNLQWDAFVERSVVISHVNMISSVGKYGQTHTVLYKKWEIAVVFQKLRAITGKLGERDRM